MAPTPTSDTARRRRGITLLEVLISCGLLVVGLSAIAALLPASGSRLTQATTEDRAAVLLSNAAAEIVNRSLIAADAFPTNGSAPTLAFGKVLERLPTLGSLPSGGPASGIFSGLSAAAQKRCGSWRTFVLEDVLAYAETQTADTPTNSFTTDGAGLGPREFRDGLCWGATLAPRTRPVAPGGKAVLSLVVFKRADKSVSGAAYEPLPVVLTRVGSVYEADVFTDDNDALLRGCTWVLALPAGATDSARWFRVMSSWNWQTPTGQRKRVVLHDQAEFEQLTNSAASGAAATVFAFEGIVRVDEKSLTLD